MAQPLPIARTNPFDPPSSLLDGAPLRPLAFPDGHVGWLVTDHGLARQVLADPRFSSKMELRRVPVRRPKVEGFETGQTTPRGFFIAMDPPDHTRYRRALTGQFTVRRMTALRPRIEQIVAERLDVLESKGQGADLVSTFALPVPSLVICELLGVPTEDRGLFESAASTLLRLDAPDADAAEAMTTLLGYLSELITRKRRSPGDDLLSGLVSEEEEFDDEELLGIALLLQVAGHETTANMLALGTFALLSHPEQAEALRSGAVPVASAVEELLRYLSIIQFGTGRAALEDLELGGQQIKYGDTVILSIPAANRDADRFAEPHTLDLARNARGHLAFGYGVHQCLGQQLARIEMAAAYPALFGRFPKLRLAVPPEEVPLRHDMAIYGVHALPVEWS
ncbi:cytochrome P450 [Saccharomonospora xinjiangensis]|uniref:cytochrome P450 n=1 Tax=Saccharomonospora xinjiangensis TaxID=75294 RepID=UPI00106F1617|nr:cytochrome P450 [Saccharomonospora xinjiangensis]QBQ59717.1 Pentalenic acid synthase [Saccharomonospora xinjiangensis]